MNDHTALLAVIAAWLAVGIIAYVVLGMDIVR